MVEGDLLQDGGQTILRREDRGAIAILTLNRPSKLNALSNELLGALTDQLDAIEVDRTVRVVVITGEGRAFSAGADIAAFQAHVKIGATEAIVHFMRPGQQMTRRVESFPKPIIAAVNGLAFGGGCELVEATHIALAARSASFSKAEINIGIIPTFGGTQRLPRNVGRYSLRPSRLPTNSQLSRATHSPQHSPPCTAGWMPPSMMEWPSKKRRSRASSLLGTPRRASPPFSRSDLPSSLARVDRAEFRGRRSECLADVPDGSLSAP